MRAYRRSQQQQQQYRSSTAGPTQDRPQPFSRQAPADPRSPCLRPAAQHGTASLHQHPVQRR